MRIKLKGIIFSKVSAYNYITCIYKAYKYEVQIYQIKFNLRTLIFIFIPIYGK
jgi:hypothetical protein